MCKIQLGLRNELKKFGLNPAEWRIRELAEQKFKIVHVADSSFYFFGETQASGLIQRWTTLRLISC